MQTYIVTATRSYRMSNICMKNKYLIKEQRKSKMIEMNAKYCVTLSGETQRRAQAVEDMQRRLEEEHALQMSLLLAEQEKAQHRLLLVSTLNYMICSKATRAIS